MNVNDNNTNTISSINKEVRVKFSTNIPELKIKETLQSMIIKTSLNKNELVAFIKKLTKYQNKKELEIFINNKLFSHANQQLSVFLLEENISTEEQILEIFYTFSLEEPKLIDSKKQDEWIKKIRNIVVNGSLSHSDSLMRNVFSVGLFNSEINFFDMFSHEKIDVLGNETREIEESDYLFLNDYCYVQGNTNSTSDNILLVKAIRDYDFSFVVEELAFSSSSSNKKRKNSTNSNKSNNTKTVINKHSSVLSGPKTNTITKLATNPHSENTFAVGTKNGEFLLYQINNYNYNANVNHDEKKKQRRVDNMKQFLPFTKELKLGDNEITAMSWLNDCFIAIGDLEYIKILNSQQLSVLNLFNVNHHLVTSLDTSKEKIVLSAHDNGSFKIWDINAKNALVHNANKAHRGFVSNIEKVSDNESLILSSGYDGVVKLWDIRKLSSCYFEFPNAAKGNEKIFDFEVLGVKGKHGNGRDRKSVV